MLKNKFVRKWITNKIDSFKFLIYLFSDIDHFLRISKFTSEPPTFQNKMNNKKVELNP